MATRRQRTEFEQKALTYARYFAEQSSQLVYLNILDLSIDSERLEITENPGSGSVEVKPKLVPAGEDTADKCESLLVGLDVDCLGRTIAPTAIVKLEPTSLGIRSIRILLEEMPISQEEKDHFATHQPELLCFLRDDDVIKATLRHIVSSALLHALA